MDFVLNRLETGMNLSVRRIVQREVQRRVFERASVPLDLADEQGAGPDSRRHCGLRMA